MISRRLHVFLPSLFLVFGCWKYASGQQGMSPILQFHGSGSTVPARCYWYILETMRSQAKIPTWMTYRAISSGPGQEELIGNLTHPFSDFTSSDYPLSAEQYNALKNASQEVIHLPVLLSAVGVFHSLPLQTENQLTSRRAIHLNLTSCLVARIFQGQIDVWNHPEILELNPSMELTEQTLPIKVVHRTAGSSSTLTFTSYLHKACPEHWEAELVGSDIVWPTTGSDRVIAVEGTSEMIGTIMNETGAIGYADSGAGVDEQLQEVALKIEQTTMKDAFFLTSENAVSKDGVAAALEGIDLPSSGSDDWSGVDVIDQVEGYIYAWPMVMISYVLVRKDLTTFIPDPRAQTLLVEFLRSLYDPVYNDRCEKEFMFLPVTGAARDLALQSIDSLEVSSDAPVWIKETEVLPRTGQGDFVISTRRQESFLIQQDLLTHRVQEAEETLEEVVSTMSEVQTATLAIKKDVDKVVSTQSKADRSVLSEKGKRIDASFAMAISSLILWFVTAVAFCYQQVKLRELESRPRIVQPEPQTRKRREPEDRDSV